MSAQEEALKKPNTSNGDQESDDSSEEDTSSEESTSSEDEDSDGEQEGQYIEMSLGLGVLEQISASEGLAIRSGTSQPASGSPTTASKHKEGEKEDVINFQPKDKKPKFVIEQNPNSVASRLPGFLAKLKAANEELKKTDAKSYRIEVNDDSDVEDENGDEASKSKDGSKPGGIEEV